MFTVKEAADMLGVSSNTIRVWTRDFDTHLSPTAAPGSGRERRFADDDMAVLWTVKLLRGQGATTDDIHAALASGQRMEPLEGQEGGQEANTAAGDSSTANQGQTAATMALELVKGQVESLQNERDYLRDQLSIEREARITAEKEAARLAGHLAAVEAAQGKEAKGEKVEARPSWWERLRGRG